MGQSSKRKIKCKNKRKIRRKIEVMIGKLKDILRKRKRDDECLVNEKRGLGKL